MHSHRRLYEDFQEPQDEHSFALLDEDQIKETGTTPNNLLHKETALKKHAFKDDVLSEDEF